MYNYGSNESSMMDGSMNNQLLFFIKPN